MINHTNKRDRLTMFLDVLKVIRKGTIKPTKIMYSANLSWKPMMNILENLAKQEIIKQTQTDYKHVTYHLTRKGVELLNYFEDAKLEIS